MKLDTVRRAGVLKWMSDEHKAQACKSVARALRAASDCDRASVDIKQCTPATALVLAAQYDRAPLSFTFR
jgi:hypothetical protein